MTDKTEDISKQPAGTQERYSTAINASNLKVVAERGGSGDILIAMAWSPSRLGAALMRLHSEFDSCAQPQQMTADAVRALAASYTLDTDRLVRLGDKRINPNDLAHQESLAWYMQELGLMFQQLKTLPAVREQLSAWVSDLGIAEPERRAAEVLCWWLKSSCTVCNGRKKERVAGTPSLSHRDCKACKGSGLTRIPHEPNNTRQLTESWKILKHIDVCIKSAQASTQGRLRGIRQRAKVAA